MEAGRISLLRAKHAVAIAIGITLLLASAKAVVGLAAGSSVLAADAVNSAGDLLAIGSTFFGLLLCLKKPTRKFPYGFYRAESLAALLTSGIIVYVGAVLLVEGFRRLEGVPSLAHPVMALTTAAISAAVSLMLSIWMKRIGRETGSQSLLAIGDDARVDMVIASAVVVTLAAVTYGVRYIEGVVTILISIAVLWTGLKNARQVVLSLMDAAVDPELERDIIAMLEEMPGVRALEKLRARRSGPFYFVDGHVNVAGSMDVSRSHKLTHSAERAIRERHPQVEAVVLHVEPYKVGSKHILVPVEEPVGPSTSVSAHFGRAPCFLFAEVEGDKVKSTAVEVNPFQQKEVRAGMAVISRFVKEKHLDAVLVRNIGQIAYHALHDNYVEIFRTDAEAAPEALKLYAAGELSFLSEPTHSSEEKLGSE